MPAMGFEPAIPASERLQNHALDREATGIGLLLMFYKAKVAVCSEIRTKHINAMWAPRRIF
jgi:hypothetical protein